MDSCDCVDSIIDFIVLYLQYCFERTELFGGGDPGRLRATALAPQHDRRQSYKDFQIVVHRLRIHGIRTRLPHGQSQSSR